MPPNTEMITPYDRAAAQIRNSTVTKQSSQSALFKDGCWENSCKAQD